MIPWIGQNCPIDNNQYFHNNPMPIFLAKIVPNILSYLSIIKNMSRSSIIACKYLIKKEDDENYVKYLIQYA